MRGAQVSPSEHHTEVRLCLPLIRRSEKAEWIPSGTGSSIDSPRGGLCVRESAKSLMRINKQDFSANDQQRIY